MWGRFLVLVTRRRLSVGALAAALVLGALSGPDTVAPATAASTDQLTVTVSEGTYRGVASGELLRWQGVRFGEEPAGSWRFQPPRPAKKFSGVRSASRPGAPCPQVTPLLPPPLNQLVAGAKEDCLFLNVFRPKGTPPAGGFPVLVFIPGGAYVLGDGAGYDPRPLVEAGRMVVVTLNYRLGPLGFLTLPATDREQRSGTSGNWGLMDQQLALRWVRKNIAAFDGNQKLVTLAGQSAGANSVCQQLISPKAHRLFQRAIVASGACVGSPLGPFPKRKIQRSSAEFARSMGCTVPAEYLPCLRKVPASKLVGGPTTAFQDLNVTWVPVVDGKIIRKPLVKAYRSGLGAKVPIMVGSTHDEGTLFTTLFFHVKLNPVSEQTYQSYLRDTFGKKAPAVASRYPSRRYGSPSLALSATSTDRLFACPARWTARALKGKVPKLWVYELNDPAPPRFIPDPFLMDQGNYHTSELAYLMNKLQGIPISRTATQAGLSAQMVASWARFARTGNPNGANDLTWKQGLNAKTYTWTSEGSRARGGFKSAHQCGFWGSAR